MLNPLRHGASRSRARLLLASTLLPAAWLGGAATASAQQAAAALPAVPAGVVETGPSTWLPKMRIGDDANYWEFYGQIDKGVLSFDDGEETDVFAIVDNANSSTRFGFRGLLTPAENWTIGANIEAEWTPYSTNHVDQLNIDDVDWDAGLLRKAEIYVTGQDVGKFWIGQGSMASDSSAEVDLSGTTVVGYSSLSDMAGGPLLRLSDGTLSDVHVKDVFTNFDGLGRKLRVRYDTPKINNFTFAGSVGTQVVPTNTDVTVWDLAGRYDNTFDDFRFSAALAFSVPGDDQSLVDGSFSVLHEPTGISLTVASAFENTDSDADGHYVYAKLGYQTDYFDFGKTAVSVDAYLGEDIGAAGSESKSVGAQLVQTIDYLQTDLYLGARLYEYDEPDQSFEDGVAVLTGARLRF